MVITNGWPKFNSCSQIPNPESQCDCDSRTIAKFVENFHLFSHLPSSGLHQLAWSCSEPIGRPVVGHLWIMASESIKNGVCFVRAFVREQPTKKKTNCSLSTWAHTAVRRPTFTLHYFSLNVNESRKQSVNLIDRSKMVCSKAGEQQRQRQLQKSAAEKIADRLAGWPRGQQHCFSRTEASGGSIEFRDPSHDSPLCLSPLAASPAVVRSASLSITSSSGS